MNFENMYGNPKVRNYDDMCSAEWSLFTEDWSDGEDPISRMLPSSIHEELGFNSGLEYTGVPRIPDPPIQQTADPPGFGRFQAQKTLVSEDTVPAVAVPYFSVCFHPRRTEVCVGSDAMDIAPGMYVITEADNGVSMGQVVGPAEQPLPGTQKKVHQILRFASEQEISLLPTMKQREEKAVEICAKVVKEKNMDLEITDAEYQFDGSQLTLYYTASNFTDFRGLVRTLFRKFSLRIWMVWYDKNEGTAVKDVFSQNKKRRVRHRKPKKAPGQ